MIVTAAWYMILAAVLFVMGGAGLLLRKNALIMFMCIELMLNCSQPHLCRRRQGTRQSRRTAVGAVCDGGCRSRSHGWSRHHRHGVPQEVDGQR